MVTVFFSEQISELAFSAKRSEQIVQSLWLYYYFVLVSHSNSMVPCWTAPCPHMSLEATSQLSNMESHLATQRFGKGHAKLQHANSCLCLMEIPFGVRKTTCKILSN
jgi:hypothetical protein